MVGKIALISVLICAAASGCSGALPISHDYAVEIGRADRLHIGQSLNAAAAGFLGPARESRQASVAMRSPQAPEIDLSARDVKYTAIKDFSVSVAHTSAVQLRPRTALTGTVRAGFEQGRYRLPEGISVFRDPASINVATTVGSVELGVRQTLIENRTVSVSFSVNRGVDVARNRISIQSDLLDLKAVSKSTARYSSAALMLASPMVQLGTTQPAASITVRRYDDTGYSALVRFVVPIAKN